MSRNVQADISDRVLNIQETPLTCLYTYIYDSNHELRTPILYTNGCDNRLLLRMGWDMLFVRLRLSIRDSMRHELLYFQCADTM
jgi:hypothetical protein